MESNALLKLDIDYQGQKVRVLGTIESPQWILADACEILGILNPSQAVQNFKPSEAGICETYISGQRRQVLTVTEAGLYRLILRSNKPEAEKFRDWVTHEVLPCIRLHGIYPAPKGLSVTGDLEAIPSRLRAIESELSCLPDIQANTACLPVIQADLAIVKSQNNQILSFQEYKRQYFSDEIKKHLRMATRECFKGLCPICMSVEVVDSDYEIPLRENGKPIAEYEHYQGRHDNEFQNGWIICYECHDKKHHWKRHGLKRDEYRPAFENFQRLAREKGFGLASPKKESPSTTPTLKFNGYIDIKPI